MAHSVYAQVCSLVNNSSRVGTIQECSHHQRSLSYPVVYDDVTNHGSER